MTTPTLDYARPTVFLLAILSLCALFLAAVAIRRTTSGGGDAGRLEITPQPPRRE